MIHQLPCDCYDCKNCKYGYCQLTYPVLDYLKIGKKMHVECTDYEELELPFVTVLNDKEGLDER